MQAMYLQIPVEVSAVLMVGGLALGKFHTFK